MYRVDYIEALLSRNIDVPMAQYSPSMPAMPSVSYGQMLETTGRLCINIGSRYANAEESHVHVYEPTLATS
jgi:hypothetical protein